MRLDVADELNVRRPLTLVMTCTRLGGIQSSEGGGLLPKALAIFSFFPYPL